MTDYESRFKLVFVSICEDANGDNEAFAFFNNGSFVINNEGKATLQVVDVNGRILKSESINGCANVNVNAVDGVYMLRLINGNSVKVQNRSINNSLCSLKTFRPKKNAPCFGAFFFLFNFAD